MYWVLAELKKGHARRNAKWRTRRFKLFTHRAQTMMKAIMTGQGNGGKKESTYAKKHGFKCKAPVQGSWRGYICSSTTYKDKAGKTKSVVCKGLTHEVDLMKIVNGQCGRGHFAYKHGCVK